MYEERIWKESYRYLMEDPTANLVGITRVPENSPVTQEELKAEVDRVKSDLAGDDTRNYYEKRLALYPSPSAQLDMLWHMMDEGQFGDSLKESKLYLRIKEVKDKFPKPTDAD